MAEPAHPLKRQRIATSACAAHGGASAAAAAGAQQQQQPQQGREQQAGNDTAAKASSAGASSGPRPNPAGKKPKQLVMPTPVTPPTVPTNPAAWENAVLLIDKPKDWTSFDVCGKLRGALARLLGKRNREVKVGHAGKGGLVGVRVSGWVGGSWGVLTCQQLQQSQRFDCN